MNLSFQRRKSMYNLIEEAAKLQANELSWISNLYRQRLETLQKTEEKRQAWLKQQDEISETTC